MLGLIPPCFSAVYGEELSLDDIHVFCQMIATYAGKGKHTSEAIAKELAENETGLCRTVNCDQRTMPRSLRKKTVGMCMARHKLNLFMKKKMLISDSRGKK